MFLGTSTCLFRNLNMVFKTSKCLFRNFNMVFRNLRRFLGTSKGFQESQNILQEPQNLLLALHPELIADTGCHSSSVIATIYQEPFLHCTDIRATSGAPSKWSQHVQRRGSAETYGEVILREDCDNHGIGENLKKLHHMIGLGENVKTLPLLLFQWSIKT